MLPAPGRRCIHASSLDCEPTCISQIISGAASMLHAALSANIPSTYSVMLLVREPTELFRITAIPLVARLDRPFTLSFDDPKGGSGSILVKMEESLPLTSSTVCVRFGLITRAPSQTCAVELLIDQ